METEFCSYICELCADEDWAKFRLIYFTAFGPPSVNSQKNFRTYQALCIFTSEERDSPIVSGVVCKEALISLTRWLIPFFFDLKKLFAVNFPFFALQTSVRLYSPLHLPFQRIAVALCRQCYQCPTSPLVLWVQKQHW